MVLSGRFAGVFVSVRARRVRRGLGTVAAVSVAGLLVSVIPGVLPPAAAVTAPGAGEFKALTPARIVDSRSGLGLSGPVVAGTVSSFAVTGRGGVPTSGVSAVALTVTAVAPSSNSWATVWAQGAPAPVAGFNVNAAQTVSTTFITKVGALTGGVSVQMGSGSMGLVVDVQGYYTDSTATTAEATFVAMPMTRVYDSRVSGGVLGAGATRTVQVLGVGGVPASGVAAVAVNVWAASRISDI